MILYLPDANVLIRAHEDYYPLDRIPAFWQWLIEQGRRGSVKIPAAIYSEIGPHQDDPLGRWARDNATRQALQLSEPVVPAQLQRVYVDGYGIGPVPNDAEQEKMGRDPFLIAAALTRPERVVVTREVSSPKKQGANRKIPNVCRNVGVRCVNDFHLWRQLDFRIT